MLLDQLNILYISFRLDSLLQKVPLFEVLDEDPIVDELILLTNSEN